MRITVYLLHRDNVNSKYGLVLIINPKPRPWLSGVKWT